MRSLWINLNPVTSVLVKKGESQRREKKVIRRWRWTEGCYPEPRNAKDCRQLPEAGKGKEGFSPGVSEESAVLLTP